MQALQQNLLVPNRKIEFYKNQIKGDQYEFVLYPNEVIKTNGVRLKAILKDENSLQPLLFRFNSDEKFTSFFSSTPLDHFRY
ncbi:hypothetical protein ABR330_10775 [Bacillus cabrialesii subsp. cabrialesii]|uniref:hypothetical protein n=1 Tax=Bacillus cabrialesii TaxID=2487276 RepID=UPI0033065CFA